MKKLLVVCMIMICSFCLIGCQEKLDKQEKQTEQESFVALEKDEIVTSKHRVEKLSWENENSY